jgi:hypothetical protein
MTSEEISTLVSKLIAAALYLTQALRIAEQMKSYPKIFNTAAMLGSVYLLANEFAVAQKTLEYAFKYLSSRCR